MRQKFIIIDREDNPWGPFDDGAKAVGWAKAKWPDQQQVNEDDGVTEGWDLVLLRPPS